MSQSDFQFLPADQAAQVKACYDSMSEKDRRRCAASLSLTLPHGGCKYLVELFGCGKSTITRGRLELEELQRKGDSAKDRVRQEGAGRPKKDVDHPAR